MLKYPDDVIDLSMDHTFKVGKPVNYRRTDDGKFAHQYCKLFIVLGSSKEVLGFELYSQSESKDVLVNLEVDPLEIEAIFVDDSCKERNFY